MRVAADADVRQVNETGMTPLTVDRFHPESCHCQTDTPGILARISCRLFRNVVGVIQEDRYPGQLQEILQGYANCFDCAAAALHGLRHLAFREDTGGPRLVRDNGPDIRAPDRRAPAHAPSLRMGDEDARADPAEQCRDRIGDHLPVERPGVRRYLAEVLVQRFRVAGEPDARKEVRPDAEPEQVVPVLVVRRCHDGGGHGAAPRTAPAGHINEVHGKSPPHKDALEAFPPIRRAPPAPRELKGAVHEHQGEPARVLGDLVLDVRVIAVECLPVRRPFQGIKHAGLLYNGSPDCETALLPDNQRSGWFARSSSCQRFGHRITFRQNVNIPVLYETLAMDGINFQGSGRSQTRNTLKKPLQEIQTGKRIPVCAGLTP